jgi:hypothetical protein
MTEAEWLACEDPEWMFRVLVSLGMSDRKLQLFDVARARTIFMPIDDRSWAAVWVAERQADGQADAKEVAAATAGAERALFEYECSGEYLHSPGSAIYGLEAAVAALSPRGPDERVEARSSTLAVERIAQVELLRCIFGNPFHPVTLDPSWLTSTVLALAEGIYSERAFDRLPILADALQDAGCENSDVLYHCRGPGPHVRGSFVVDLLTGRT